MVFPLAVLFEVNSYCNCLLFFNTILIHTMGKGHLGMYFESALSYFLKLPKATRNCVCWKQVNIIVGTFYYVGHFSFSYIPSPNCSIDP